MDHLDPFFHTEANQDANEMKPSLGVVRCNHCGTPATQFFLTDEIEESYILTCSSQDCQTQIDTKFGVQKYTSSHVYLINYMVRLWLDHVEYTREVTNFSLFAASDAQLSASLDRLVANQKHIGEFFNLFFFQHIGQTVENLLTKHIQKAKAILNEMNKLDSSTVEAWLFQKYKVGKPTVLFKDPKQHLIKLEKAISEFEKNGTNIVQALIGLDTGQLSQKTLEFELVANKKFWKKRELEIIITVHLKHVILEAAFAKTEQWGDSILTHDKNKSNVKVIAVLLASRILEAIPRNIVEKSRKTVKTQVRRRTWET